MVVRRLLYLAWDRCCPTCPKVTLRNSAQAPKPLYFWRPGASPARRRCADHHAASPPRFLRHGSYLTRRGFRVQRFLCRRCHKTFSRRAFSVAYYLKRPELLQPVAAGLQAGSAHRQLARTLGCAPSTVTRLSARLGRQGKLDEPVVIDHFETFELTQDLPFGVALPVGARSWFIYGLEAAPHARTGRRTEAQERRRRRRPPRSARGGYSGSITRMLDRLLPLVPSGRILHLRGDGHPAYQWSVRKHSASGRMHLECHPNPPRGPKGSPRSKRAVARDRAMFPVDSLHGLLRHSLAAHRRETIAFGRRLNALAERLFLAIIWRNFVKKISERRSDPTTPAMIVGVADNPWSWSRVLARRIFPWRTPVGGSWEEIYRRDWGETGARRRCLPTPGIGRSSATEAASEARGIAEAGLVAGITPGQKQQFAHHHGTQRGPPPAGRVGISGRWRS